MTPNKTKYATPMSNGGSVKAKYISQSTTTHMDLLRKIKSLGSLRERKCAATKPELPRTTEDLYTWYPYTPRPIELMWPNTTIECYKNIQRLKDDARARVKSAPITTFKEQMEWMEELEGLVDVMLDEYWAEPMY
jgi:hypothetical protein